MPVVMGITKYAAQEEVNAAVAPLVGKTLGLHPKPPFSLEEQTGPLMAELDRAAGRVAGLAEQGKATMADTNRLLAASLGLPDDLTVLLQELARAARSVRVLAEFLERQPNALIRGRTASAP